jgi:hypothetical protein
MFPVEIEGWGRLIRIELMKIFIYTPKTQNRV